MDFAIDAWLPLGAVVALLCASAFFSCTEIAIFSLPEGWEPGATDRASGDRDALSALRSDPHRLLVTLLVGNNLVNIAISSLITVVLVSVLPGGLAVVAATLLASSVVLVFGEILPKAYGLAHAERWALTAARPITVVGYVLYPLVAVFDFVTRGLSDAVGGDQRIEQPYTDESPAEAD